MARAGWPTGGEMIIAIDWNSTLQNQIGEICQRTNLRPADFDQWDKPLGYRCGMSEEAFTRWAWTDESIQAMAQPYPGAARAVAELKKKNKIWIVTSTACPALVAPWFRRHNIRYDKLILTSDKGSVPWDVLIDDSPITLAALAGTRRVLRHIVEWNKHLVGIEGVSWQ